MIEPYRLATKWRMPVALINRIEVAGNEEVPVAGDDPGRFVDRYVQIGDIKLRYVEAGKNGPPLVLLHGLGASVEIWQSTLVALSRDHRVLALDLPGFGRSGKPAAPHTPTYFAVIVRDFVDAMGLARTTLVGHSLGGAVALRFALDFPVRLERLGLVASAALGRGGSLLLRLMSLPGVGELLSRPSRAGTALLFKLATHNPGAVSDAVVDVAYHFARFPGAQRSFLATLRALANFLGQRHKNFRPILDGLRQISVPTLVLWGRQDRILPVAHATSTRAIPGALIDVWDQCGHLPMLEYPDRFNTLLRNFLSQK